MRRSRVCSCLTLFVLGLAVPGRLSAQSPASPKIKTVEGTAAAFLSFEQIPDKRAGSGDTFTTRSSHGTAVLRKEAVVFASGARTAAEGNTEGPLLRMEFAGSNRTVQIAGEQVLPGKTYHATAPFTGPLNGNPTFRQVRYRQLYTGIDAIFYGRERDLEFDFEVAPRTDPQQIRLSLTGADRVVLEPSGDLSLGTLDGEVRFRKPVIYQNRDGVRHEIAGGYEVAHDGTEVRFRVGPYDHNQPLIIDPTVSFATYFGGAGDETASRIQVNAAGEIYLLGTTGRPDMLPPHQSVPVPVQGFSAQCFLTKLAPGGTAVLYTVVFDGGFCGAMDLGRGARVHLALSYSLRTLDENTMSLDLLQGAYDLGPGDGPVAHLRADATGNVYFITTYTPDTVASPSFVFELRKIDGAGRIAFHAPLIQQLDLANFQDQVQALDVDDQNRAYVVGNVRSDGVITPTPDAFQALKSASSQDGFLLKVNTLITDPVQGSVEYATYIGGEQDDHLNAVLFDAATNSVLISGFTGSPDFPTTAGSFAPSYSVVAPNFEAVLARLDLDQPPDQQMVFGTYLSARSTSFALDLLPGGFPVISGYTADHPASPGDPAFPLVDSLYPPFLLGEQTRNYLSIFSPDASSLLFSTYLTPAPNAEFGTPEVATNGSQTLYVLNDVNLDGLAVPGVSQPSNAGGYDLLLRALNVSDLVPASGADLSVAAVASPEPAVAGSTFTYAVVIRNLGPQPASDVSLNLAFAPSVTFQRASRQGPLSCSPAAASSATAVLCSVGTIPAASAAAIDFVVAPHVPGSVTAVVHVSSATADPNPANDEVVLATVVNAPRAQTTTTIAASLNPSTAGRPVIFTASVSGAAPTGTVTFLESGSPLGTASLTGGSASLMTTALSAGTRTITASYSGDVSNLASTSSAVVQTVNPPYTIVDLGAIGAGDSSGWAINNNGQVAGASTTAASGAGSIQPHAFVISAPYTSMIDLGTLGGDLASHGSGINNLGQVTGYSLFSSTGGGASRAFLSSPPYPGMAFLGTLGGSHSSASGINDSGQITGESETADERRHAFLWDGTMQDLETLGGDPSGSSGYAINASGQITGVSTTPAGGSQAFLYAPAGGMTALGGLPGAGSFGASVGSGVNTSGHVTGWALAGNGREHAFLWDGTMHDLGTLGGPYSIGAGINASDQVVGRSAMLLGGERPFLYTKANGMVDVNTLLPNGSGWDLTQANAINDLGQITGLGTKTTCGPNSCLVLNHAFLLTPPPPSMGAIINGAALAKPPSGMVDAVFPVTFSNTGNGPVDVSFRSVDGTARAEVDYVAMSGTLTFAPGVTTQNITAQVIGGLPNASHVSFSVELNDATNGTLLGTAVGTILVPAPPPQIAFRVTASPSSLALQPSSDRPSTITLQSENGVTEAARLTAAWTGVAPGGVTFTLFPATVSIPPQATASATTTLTVVTSASPSVGTFALRVTATSASGVTKSAAVTVVITARSEPPPSTCCTSSGPFVDPAPGVNVDVKRDGASPSGKYQVAVSGGAPAGFANITVTRASDQHVVLTAQTAQWGFSPDDDRFVTHFVQNSGAASIHQVALYDLTRANPQAPTWTRGDATHSSRIQFSPSGRYLFYTDVVDGPSTQLVVANARSGTVLFSTSFPQTGGAPVEGADAFGTIGWGFGPNDSRFVYAYSTGPTAVEWNLVNLEKGPGHGGVTSLSLLDATSAFWQFSSCGEVIGLVQQPGQQFVFVDLYRTSDGTPAGPEAQIAAPVQDLQLRTTATAHVARVNGSINYTVGPIVPVCSAPPPPPPPGPTCCTSAGPFVNPSPGVNLDIKRDGASPSRKYQVVVSGGGGAGLATISVRRASDQQILLTTQTAHWGFSPDDDRFVTHAVQDPGGASIHHVALYDLTRANPQGAIWSSSDSTHSARIQFSPSGRYLFYTDVAGGPTQLTLVSAQTGTTLFSASFPHVGGVPVEGQDTFGTIGWGFGPNDSRFVYGYLSGATNVEWNLVNLEKGPAAAGVKSLSLLNETSDWWQFSSCGEVIALVRQPGQQSVSVGLYRTGDGTAVGTEVQIAAPVQQLQLRSAGTRHVATVNGATDYTLGTSTPACTLSVTAHSPVDILLLDEHGRRTGFESGAGLVVNEIPGGSYTGVRTEPQTITVPYVAGTYRIEAYGLASLMTPSPYRLTIATAGETDSDEHDIAGMASSRTLQQFAFTIDDHLVVTSLSAVDTTPPVIRPDILGTRGTNGWYTGEVAINWNVVDGESPVQSSSGCASAVVSADTAGTTFSCTATSAGGIASSSVTLKRDTTPPMISCGSPDGQWRAGDVSIACAASDSGSGLAGQGSTSFVLTTAVPAGTETSNASTGVATVCDMAGNCTSAGPIGGSMIDKRAPAITLARPANGAVYAANQAVTASYSCSDSGSGVARCAGTVANGERIDTTPNGVSTAKSFAANALDAAGNAATQHIDYLIACRYVEIGVSPSTVQRNSKVTVTARVSSCASSSQTIQVKFALSGPHRAKACGSTKTLMFTTPRFTVAQGTSRTVSFPFNVEKALCQGTYAITATTLIDGVAVETTQASLTVR